MSELVLERNNEIPKGWELTTLEEITYEIQKINPKETPDKKFRYCDIDSIDNEKLQIINPKTVIGNSAPSRARQLIKENDVLFSTVRTYLHNIAMVPYELNNQLCSTGFCVLRSFDPITSKFIFFRVQANEFLRYLNPLQRGTSYPAVRNHDVKNYKFFLPPLDEQKRIISKIEELFSIIDSVIENLNKIKIQIKLTKQSLLMSAFEKKSQTWKEETINDVVKIIDYRGRTPPYNDEGIPHLRSNNVKNGRIIWKKLKFVSEETYEKYMTRGIPKNGDLLFTTEAPLGEVSLIPKEKFSLAQRLMILRPLAHDSKFLMYQIMSPDFDYRLTGKKTGTTVTGVSSRNFKPMKIYTTSQEEENKISMYLESQFSKLDSVLLIIEKYLNIISIMKNSVLIEAFKGKLVPQDPNDEPVEILLQKIKQEKEILEQKQKIIKAKRPKKRRKNVK